jgi:uncharacterized protein
MKSSTRRCQSFVTVLFGSMISLACNVDAAEDAVLDDFVDDPVTSELRNRGERNYTRAELEALAASPEVKALNEPFAASPPADVSIHVAMSDGVRRAVSLYFPSGFERAAERAPVAYFDAWYGRGLEATGEAIEMYRGSGFVVAIADVRGVGASFGALPTFVTPEVRRDERDMIAWLSSQPWSDGRVAGAGFSISALYAEVMASSGAPALGAAVLRASDFDHYAYNVFPGGIPNPRMLGLIHEVGEWMRGEPCIADLSVCGFLGIAPVDADDDFSLLQAAFRDHSENLAPGALETLAYRDDPLGTGTVDDISPSGMIAELRRDAIPARVSGSWLDGTTAASALARFRALPGVPMEVSIGATAHSGGVDADPFSRSPFRAARPGAPAQMAADIAFVKRALAGDRIARSVSYVVLGTDTWKTTSNWPPAGVGSQRFELEREELVEHARSRAGEVVYEVDPTTSSGAPFNRWASQGGKPVFYGDRRMAPGRRLSFDAAPLARDVELVGAAELCLALRVDQPDATVFAYLEDVAPDGRVTHLTEGELRLIHRKVQGARGVSGCDPAEGTNRTFARADARAVTPGELMRVEIPFLPTAALVRKGHRVRLTLTGADAETFPALTATPPTFRVPCGRGSGSSLTIPVKAWSPR